MISCEDKPIRRSYLLSRRGRVGYAEYAGFVIRATDEVQARNLAAGSAGDEDAKTWLSPNKSFCSLLGPEGPSAVILCDFQAG